MQALVLLGWAGLGWAGVSYRRGRLSPLFYFSQDEDLPFACLASVVFPCSELKCAPTQSLGQGLGTAGRRPPLTSARTCSPRSLGRGAGLLLCPCPTGCHQEAYSAPLGARPQRRVILELF